MTQKTTGRLPIGEKVAKLDEALWQSNQLLARAINFVPKEMKAAFNKRFNENVRGLRQADDQ